MISLRHKCCFRKMVIMRNCTLIKKKIKFSSYIRIFRVEQLQRHIYTVWLTASSYMGKYLRISSYIRKPFLPNIWLCNCSTQNFPIYKENLIFFFISVQASGLRPDVGRNEERGRVHQPDQAYHTTSDNTNVKRMTNEIFDWKLISFNVMEAIKLNKSIISTTATIQRI